MSGARSNLGGKAKPSSCGRTDVARGCKDIIILESNLDIKQTKTCES